MKMKISEAQFSSWSGPVSTTEDEKCKRAIAQVTDAIRKKFGNKVSIFLQGSYQNNTNVKQDSDVDVVVRHDGYFYHDLQRLSDADKAIYEANRSASNYTFAELKEQIHAALIAEFGAAAKRKDKCIEIIGNSYRITADVVPCFVHRRFSNLKDTEVSGIQFYSDRENEKIVSFPEQHHSNGVTKTNATGRMYKRTVRILKVMRNIMVEKGIITDGLASSFFIECLVYNVADRLFLPGNYELTVRNIITQVYSDMRDVAKANDYTEVSGFKWLFRGNSKRPSENGRDFMFKCWQYAGFE
jgi:predicted nucleotidyltransferase